MTDPGRLRMLARYGAWANDRLYDALQRVPAATVQAPRRSRPQGLLGVLGHMVAVGLIWQGHLSGRPHGLASRSLDPLPPLDELRVRQAGLDRWYVDYVDAQPAGVLAETLAFSFVDGGAGAMRRDDMVLHVVNHGTYHRGYVADMLYEDGGKPPTMDLPVYLRDAAG